MLPWRRKIEAWFKGDSPEWRSIWTAIKLTNRRISDMAELLETVKKELAELKDAVVAVKSSVEQLRKAYEFLRDHPKVIEVIKDDPELARVSEEIDGLTKDLADSVAKAGASGGA